MSSTTPTLSTRRERQREATLTEIVAAARELLADDAELSLRAVAARMGVTAPALYRYVTSYQDLLDLVAAEIDRATSAAINAAMAEHPAGDPAARLIVAVVEFRRWALANRGEFALIFANPIAEQPSSRREMITIHSCCLQMTDLIFELWRAHAFPVPALAELPATLREVLADPLIPADVEKIPLQDRGLVWIYMQGWTQLYGVLALEVMGHMDPRVIESGEMFIDVIRRFAPTLGLDDDLPRLEDILRKHL